MDQMDNLEEKDPVWDLLDEARPPAPGPFFARNVVREVRRLEESISWRGRFVGWFRCSPAISAGALATVAIAAAGLLFVVQSPDDPAPSDLPISVVDPASPVPSFDPASELEAVEYLGQLMAVTDPGQLSDEALGDLFF